MALQWREERDPVTTVLFNASGYVRSNVSQFVTVATNQYLEGVIQRSGQITQAMLIRAVQFSVNSNVSSLQVYSILAVRLLTFVSPLWLVMLCVFLPSIA